MASNAPLIIQGSNTVNVLPRNFRRTLRYAETFSFTTGAAGICGTVQAMAMNGCYDPNITGVGHQPYGFDQLSAFFNRFLVHSCSWTLVCSTIGGTAEVAVISQIRSPSGTSTAGISVDAATEKQMCTVFPLGPSGNDRARAIRGVSQMHDVFGVTRQQYIDNISQYAGTTSGNPSINAILEVGIASYNGTAGETCSIQIILDMDTEFFDPLTMAQS